MTAAADFRDGLLRHGIRAGVENARAIMSADLAVMWSYRWKNIMLGQRSVGADYLIQELGYIERTRYRSFSFNGLHGEAEFVPAPDGERFERLFARHMRPWRKSRGKHWLIAGQVPGDAALRGLNAAAWAVRVARELAAATEGAEIYYRPHPVGGAPVELPIMPGELEEAMAEAIAVVTYTSNAAVDAVFAGIPAVTAHPGSPAYPVAAHDYRALRPCRRKWAHDLSYRQWTPDEIRAGEAWEHLKKRYD